MYIVATHVVGAAVEGCAASFGGEAEDLVLQVTCHPIGVALELPV